MGIWFSRHMRSFSPKGPQGDTTLSITFHTYRCGKPLPETIWHTKIRLQPEIGATSSELCTACSLVNWGLTHFKNIPSTVKSTLMQRDRLCPHPKP